MTNKYWLFCLLVLSIISFASITASNEFVTATQYGAASHSANNQPQWVPSNAAASSSSDATSGDDHSHSGDDHSHSSPSSLPAHHHVQARSSSYSRKYPSPLYDAQL